MRLPTHVERTVPAGWRYSASLLALLTILCCLGSSSQGADAIAAPAPASLTHDYTDQPQVFPESRWQALVENPTGATVQFTASPFAHQTVSDARVDTKLDLRALNSDWAVIATSAATAHASGNTSATVAAVTDTMTAGDALGLTVTFLSNDHSRLSAGTYTLTITGTITAN